MLVDLYDRGMREPLPLVLQDLRGVRVGGRGRSRRRGRRGEPRMDVDVATTARRTANPSISCVLGGVLPFDGAARGAAARGRAGAGWELTETTRLGRYARRLWDGLLACEELTSW